MNPRILAKWTATALVMASALMPPSAAACAACFGRSDSPMAQGMNMGIVTLLFVVVSVLLGIAAFFFYILRRAARLADGPRVDMTAGSNHEEPASSRPTSKSTP